MVGGLETFRDAFREYSDCFVIIGGTACEEVLQGTDQKPRATLDIDLIVIADNITPQFARRFWQFISDGAYRPGIRKNADGSLKYVLYSFIDGKPGYPIQIELLSHHNEVFSSSRPSHIEPLPIDGDVSSLSVIILDEPYYRMTVQNSFVSNGLRYAEPTALMALKARAYLNLLKEREEGHRVNTKDILKHRNDVMKLAATTIIDEPVNVDGEIISTIEEFIGKIWSSLPSQSLQDSLRTDNESIEAYLEILRNFFESI